MTIRLGSISKKFLLVFISTFILENFFNLPLIEIFGLRDFRSGQFAIYQLFTHIFLHANLNHLLRNSFAFWMFGTRLELVLGKKNFIALVIVSILGSVILQSYITHFNISKIKKAYENYLEQPNYANFKKFMDFYPISIRKKYIDIYENLKDESNSAILQESSKKIVIALFNLKKDIPSIGASGIIFGFLTGFTMLFPNEPLYFMFLPIPIKAKYFTVFYGLYELYMGSKNNPADNVGHFAHLGGMIAVFIFLRILIRRKQKNF